MNLIEFIKRIFRKQPKMIEEKSTIIEEKKPILEGEKTLIVEDNPINRNQHIITPKEKRKEFLKENKAKEKIVSKGLDFAIDQYLNALIYQMQKGEEINSYRALTGLGGLDNKDAGHNFQNQNALINQIENNERLVLGRQPEDINKPAGFYHVITKGWEEPEEEMVKLYINAKRKNISLLSAELINELGEEDYYFKFIADENIAKTPRQEAIVIYTDEVKAQKILQALERIKSKNEKLFEGSEQGNPFMKRTLGNSVCYVPEVEEGKYIAEDGTESEIIPSYNNLLATTLYDSFINSMIRQSNKNINLRKRLANEKYVEGYLDSYAKMDDKQKYELRQEMKKSLKMAQMRNPKLDIIEMDTVNLQENPNRQDKNNDYTQTL